jgi:hypothetical protein
MKAVLLAPVLMVAAMGIAQAEQCDDQAAQIINTMKASLNRRVTFNVFLELSPLNTLSVACIPGPGLEVAWGGDKPSAIIFPLIGKAANIVLDAAPGDAQTGTALCLQHAARDPAEQYELDFKGLHFNCGTSSRHAGERSVHISR